MPLSAELTSKYLTGIGAKTEEASVLPASERAPPAVLASLPNRWFPSPSIAMTVEDHEQRVLRALDLVRIGTRTEVAAAEFEHPDPEWRKTGYDVCTAVTQVMFGQLDEFTSSEFADDLRAKYLAAGGSAAKAEHVVWSYYQVRSVSPCTPVEDDDLAEFFGVDVRSEAYPMPNLSLREVLTSPEDPETTCGRATPTTAWARPKTNRPHRPADGS